MLVAAMRISLVAFLFLMSIYMSHEIVTMPRLGTYSTISRSMLPPPTHPPTHDRTQRD